MPLNGQGTLRLDQETGIFTLRAETRFRGSETGLSGPQGEMIEVSIWMASATPRAVEMTEPSFSLEEEELLDFPGF